MKPVLFIAATLVYGLAACTSIPAVEVSGRGNLAPTIATTFVSEEVSNGSLAPATGSMAVHRALTERGWSVDPNGPAWKIETFYSQRPASVAAYTGQNPPADGSEEWRIASTPRPWWRRETRLAVLVLRIVDARSGVEAARAEARTKLNSNAEGVDLDRMAAAVVAEALGERAEPSAATRQ